MSARRRNPWTQKSPRPSARKRRSRFSLIIFGLFVVVLLWFAPLIVVNSPLKDHAIRTATKDFAGEVSIGSISVGWLSPIRVDNIVVVDEQGEPLAKVGQFKTSKSLVSLLTNLSNLGAFTIVNPEVNLVLDLESSNLERAIAGMMEPADEESAPISCSVIIVNGKVVVTDQVTGQQWAAESLHVSADLPDPAVGPIVAQVRSNFAYPSGQPGRFQADVTWSQVGELGRGKVRTSFSEIRLEMGQPFVRRAVPDVFLQGVLDGETELSWTDDTQEVVIDQLSLTSFALLATRWLGQDQIMLERVRTTGKLTHETGDWTADGFIISSDVARLELDGVGKLPGDSAAELTELVGDVMRGNYQLTGQVDVGGLAQMMPHTLHVREGTQVTSGTASFSLRGQSQVGSSQLAGHFELVNLAATHGGRAVTWAPINGDLDLRHSSAGLELDRLAAQASFLQVSARGTVERGAATLESDLDRFVREASQFIDLGNVRLSGRWKSQLDWGTTGTGAVSLKSESVAEQFTLDLGQGLPWVEERLQLTLQAQGARTAAGEFSLASASVGLTSGADRLSGNLTQAVPSVTVDATWPVALTLQGELSTWMPRVQMVAPVSGLQLDGSVDLQATASVSTKQVDLQAGKLRLRGFTMRSGGLSLREPAVEVSVHGRWDQELQSLQLADTTLASSSVAVSIDELQAVLGEAFRVSGKLGCRGDLERIAEWTRTETGSQAVHVKGQLTGTASMEYQQGVVHADWSGEIADFAYFQPAARTNVVASASQGWDVLWSDPKIKMDLQAGYEPAANQVTIQRFELAGDAVSLGAAGRITELDSACYVNLSGQLGYDLQRVMDKMRSKLGNQIQLAGRETRPFEFRGPLFAQNHIELEGTARTVAVSSVPAQAPLVPAELFAAASLAWSAGDVHGIVLGPGEVNTQLKDGMLKVAPIDIEVSGGRLRAAPEIDFSSQETTVLLPDGAHLEQLKISPTMCQTWLKYVTPIVADATAAEGEVSVAIERARVPVSAPASGEVKGEVVLHSVQVGPGPLAQQLMHLTELVKAIVEKRPPKAATNPGNWLRIPEQRVDFHLAENRVHHEGLRMQVDDVVVVTSGSVGLDQSLQLLATVPIQDAWVANDRYLASLRGQVVQVPIRGTATRPRLDMAALDRFGRQFATQAAGQILQQEITRGLNRLLGPPPQN